MELATTGNLSRTERLLQSENLWGYLFLAPSLVGLFGFTLGPVAAAFVLSFFRWDVVTPPVFVGLGNYETLVRDPLFWKTLRNTLYYVVGVIPPAMVISFLLAVALNQRLVGRTVFRIVYFMPVVSSTVAIAILWAWLYNTEFGLINFVLRSVGLPKIPWLSSSDWAMPAIIVMSVWKTLGYDMVLFLAGLQGIPNEYYEAAKIDGANGLQTLWYVTVPLLTPTTFLVLVLSVVGSFQVFEQTYVMTAGGPAWSTLTIVLLIFFRAFQDFRMGSAAALAYVLFAIILVFTLAQIRLQRRWVHYGV